MVEKERRRGGGLHDVETAQKDHGSLGCIIPPSHRISSVISFLLAWDLSPRNEITAQPKQTRSTTLISLHYKS